eukprot:m.14600 g.14600  ORF g.14600 m.14600 type:complete len:72 (+) comp25848_c0_seq2:631-846(+)
MNKFTTRVRWKFLEMSKSIVVCEIGGTREPDRMEVVRHNMFSLAMPPNPVHRLPNKAFSYFLFCTWPPFLV